MSATLTETAGTSIIDLIDTRLATLDPHACAVSCAGTALTWQDLDSWAWATAAHLTASGAGHDDVLPVLAARGGAMVAGWLGVLRTGAAYAPLSLDSPAQRLRYILVELGARTVLADSAGEAMLDSLDLPITVVRLEVLRPTAGQAPTPPVRRVHPAADDRAVVIYTSGTTGRPKGVQLAHRGILNTALWWASVDGLNPGDRVLCTWSTSFDMANFDVYRSLVAGAELVLADDVERRDPGALLGMIRGPRGATVTSMTPSLLRGMLEADHVGGPTTLRVVTAAGEVLTRQLALDCGQRWQVQIRNAYGPAEVSGFSTTSVVDPTDERQPTIGEPLPNTRAYVLGRHQEELPAGVPGELYLAGAGVGLGYFGQPERTAASFLPDPFDADPHARLYRSGDRVVVRADGQLEFLGRFDDQVKILGNRIEPSEVRALLEEQPAVQAAAVHAEGTPPRLVAHVVLSTVDETPPTKDEVLGPLLRWLPPAVLPAEVFVVDALPLTANDKIDFGALAGLRSARLPEAPRRPAELSADERVAAELFLATLKQAYPDAEPPEIGPAANFFTLGGHSLLAVKMLADGERRGHPPVTLRAFLADPTVAGLGQLLATGSASASAPPGDADPGGTFVATPVQQRFWFIDRIPTLRSAYLMPTVVEFSGPVDPEALGQAVRDVLGRHPALRSRFELNRRARQVGYRTDGPPPTVSVTKVTSLDAEEVREHLATACWSPFDLATQAPARAEVLTAGDRALLLLVVHHIVADGWSRGLLLEEIAEVYRAAREGRPARLAEPAHPASLTGEPADPTAMVAALRGAPTDIELPHDRPRRELQPTLAATETVVLDTELTSQLRTVTGGAGCTTFMAAAAVLAVALARTSSQRDFLFAFPWAGRDTPASATAVGMFVNTLVLRVDLRASPTWLELLAQVRDHSGLCLRQADVAFDALASALHPDRDLSRPPLTPVYLAFADEPARAPALGGSVTSAYRPLDPLHVKYELELTVTDLGTELEFALAYVVDLFEASTCAQLLDAVATAVADLTTDPHARPV